MSARIIVVEDEPLIRELYVRTLETAGFDVVGAADAAACSAVLRQAAADLVMLDLGLPGLDGMSFARELRRTSDVGVIVVSRRHLPEDRIAALELGCDDYLVKPVHLGELCARVQAVLRRRVTKRRMRFGTIVLDLDARSVELDGHAVDLTRGEFTILEILAKAGGNIVGRERLSGSVSRSPAEVDLRTVDSLVRRIRRKLESRSAANVIVTVSGLGYRLGVPIEDC